MKQDLVWINWNFFVLNFQKLFWSIFRFNCDFFLKSNSPKKVRSDIDHSKSTNHKHHFCQRDHGSISHLFSSRLVSKFYSKLKFYHKTLNSSPIDPKLCTMVVSGQENFLMSKSPWRLSSSWRFWNFSRTT